MLVLIMVAFARTLWKSMCLAIQSVITSVFLLMFPVFFQVKCPFKGIRSQVLDCSVLAIGPRKHLTFPFFSSRLSLTVSVQEWSILMIPLCVVKFVTTEENLTKFIELITKEMYGSQVGKLIPWAWDWFEKRLNISICNIKGQLETAEYYLQCKMKSYFLTFWIQI